MSNTKMSQTTEVKKTSINKDVDFIKGYERYVNRCIQTLHALDIDTTNNKYLNLQKR
ncbi:MAG: hypothetical protein ACI9R6_000448 [Saprospiraceae bacterium]|jgi:hypothetical protein